MSELNKTLQSIQKYTTNLTNEVSRLQSLVSSLTAENEELRTRIEQLQSIGSDKQRALSASSKPKLLAPSKRARDSSNKAALESSTSSKSSASSASKKFSSRSPSQKIIFVEDQDVGPENDGELAETNGGERVIFVQGSSGELSFSSQNSPQKSVEDKTMPKKYYEVVRKQSLRKALPAVDCEHCAEFYDAVALNDEDRAKLLQKCGRHRNISSPPSTPKNFWKFGFPDEDFK